MIKKLRMKLIIASMISLLAVLLIIEGIAGALNCCGGRSDVGDFRRK